MDLVPEVVPEVVLRWRLVVWLREDPGERQPNYHRNGEGITGARRGEDRGERHGQWCGTTTGVG